ncbi:immunoglobulin domain-containing protein [Pontibacter sp. JH31]|uniref:Immunoglobulin domain-containing protein n=1 Tax=Pontibacter aquaedesilientis TaxID=2766980 RepID=A0ABR7XHT2_9BACT|nr:immunoglobulin domain-containing protein [Pontibacter aquaedesilientis]MBD1397842.1 immunoglobulin domain-containing protein [Pontibacter aquaedesilientis]
MTHGAARQIVFTQQPTNTDIYTSIAPAVRFQDQFGNIVTTGSGSTASVSIAIGNNPVGSNGTLSGTTTVNAVSGVATFSGLSINAAGTGYTLVASSSGFTSVASNAFNINSVTPTLNAITACITEGSGAQTLVLSGSNFDRNAVARVDGTSRTTVFNNANQLTVSLTAADVQTAGTRTITVLNPGPPDSKVSDGQTLTIRPNFANATISGNSTACSGQTLTYTVPTGFTSYLWQIGEGATIASSSANSASIAFNATAPVAPVRITVTATNACGVRTSTSRDITVNQTPNAEITYTGATTFCEGSELVLSATTGTGYTYQWFNGSTEVGTSSTYTANATGSYRVTVTSAEGCSKQSEAVNITVTPTLGQGAISGTLNYCQNATASLVGGTVTGGGSASISYLWEQSPSGTGNWTAAAGTNNLANYSPSTASGGTTYYRRTIAGGGCTNTSDPVAVEVTPTIVNTISGGGSVCSGATISKLTGTFSGGQAGDVTYLWEQSPTGSASSWTAAEGTNNEADYTPTPKTVTTNTTTLYRRTVTSGYCTSVSGTVSVTVTAPPVAEIEQGTQTYFCPGDVITLSAKTGSNYSYTWYRVGNTNPVGLARLFDVDQTGNYYVEVTDGNGCISTSSTINVGSTVVDNNIISGTQTICYGATPEELDGSPATSDIPGEAVLYQWQFKTGSAAFANVATGGTGENYTPGNLTETTVYRRLASVGQCVSTSDEVTVTVRPELVLSSNRTPAAICSGTNFDYTATSATSGTTFSWVRQSAAGITTTAPSSGSTASVSHALTNTTAAPVNVTYTYTLTANGCTNTQDVVVRVNPTPVLNSTLTPAICSGVTFSYTATSATATTTFSWARQTLPTGVTATGAASGTAAGTGNQVLTNSGTAPANVTYRYTLTANGCTNTQDVVVTVNPTPVLSSTLTPAAICSGDTFSYTASSATLNTTFSWARQTLPTGVTATGAASGTAAGTGNQVLTNSGTAPANVTYRYTLTANGCTNIQDVVVRVNPTPKLSSTLTPAAICSGNIFSYTATSATANTTFSWVRQANAAINGGATSSGSTPTINETLTSTSSSFTNVTYSITMTANGCPPNTQEVVVRVNPTPVASFTGVTEGQTIYSASGNITLTPTGTTGGSFSIASPAGTSGMSSGGVLNPCTALGTADEKTITIRYTVTSGSGGNACTSTADKSVTLKKTTYTAVNFATPFPICKGQNTEYRAIVYRDVIVVPVTDTRHPSYNEWFTEPNALRRDEAFRYWQPFVGVLPLDANGKLQPAPASLIMNPDDVDKSSSNLFDYQWYKNGTALGNDRVTTRQAGLSATDEFWVLATPKNPLYCTGSSAALRSNSLWISTPANYSFTLTATNPICAGQGTKLTATPNVNFNFSNVNLELYFYIKKANSPAEEPPVVLNPGQPVTQPVPGSSPAVYEYNVAPGMIENGDVISIHFQTDVVKCLTSGDQGSFVTMVVNQPPVIATQPSDRAFCANSTATLTVGATGTGLTYQWYKRPGSSTTGNGTAVANNGRISGATTATLTFDNAQAGDAGNYYVIVSGVCPSPVTSVNAQLTINPVTVMTVQPVGGAICPGASHTFNATATGTNVTYQWLKNGVAINGATGSSYTISNAVAGDAGDYTVRATGNCGILTSSVATLIINTLPAITTQPTAAQACVGGTASFSVAASGTGVTYQWQKNGGNITGATSNTLTLTSVQTSDAGNYRVIVSGTCSPSQTSNAVALTVNTPPAITAAPQPVTVCEGQSASFSVGATGTGLSYVWRKNGDPITGATSSSYTISNVNRADAGNYTVTVSGTCGTPVTTLGALLTVDTAPEIQTQPVADVVCAGETATFSVDAVGTGLTYQWQKNGANISGANSRILTLNNVQPADAGNYRVVVKGTCSPLGETSAVAALTVNTAPQITADPESVTVCEGRENVSFSVVATGAGITYQWYRNGAAISGARASTYTVPVANNQTAGNYTVLVAGTCFPPITSEVALLTVNPMPVVTVNSPAACESMSATVTATTNNGSGNYTYSWVVPNGVANPGNVASFETTVAGQYTVRVTDSQACESVTQTSTVTINPVIQATGDILIYDENGVQVMDPRNMKSGEKYTFKVQSNILDNNDANVSAIEWYMGDGSESGWVLKQTGGTEYKMTEPMGTLKVSIRCDIPKNPGTCYSLLADRAFSLSTEAIVPLPVELIYFKAMKRGNDVAMEWATASEQDNKGFEVQVSTDAKNFRSLGFVESKVQTTSLKQVYTFVDKENGKHGTRYYRLKQVDLDGQFEYFSTKAVSFGEVTMNKVKAYPNPFESEVELSIDAEGKGDVLVTVTNATGQQLLQRTIKVEKGANVEKLVLDPNLPRGIYIISTRMGDFTNHFKLLKQ